jgi:hypothetical protein
MLRQSTDQPFPTGQREAWYSGLARRAPAKLLVFAGVLLFVLYILMDIVASLAYDGYSYKDQTISELSAIDAPTRTFWMVGSVMYQFFAFAFAVGVLAIAGNRRKVRIVGWLLFVAAVSGFLWWIAPMHQREVLAADGGTWQDTMHLVVGGISSILFFSMIGVGAFALGWRFRWYSFVTVGLMLVFGMLMNADIPHVGDNQSTPWLGIWERIAIEGEMLWEAVFATVLLWYSPAKQRV